MRSSNVRAKVLVLPALVALVALAMVPASPVTAAPSAPTGAVRVAALQPRAPIGATRIGDLPNAQELTIAVVLGPTRPEALAARLAALYDPASPQYRRWLAPEAFVRAFGPSRAQIGGTTAWLHARGLSDTRVEGFAVKATGTAQAVASALGVSFARYRLAGGAIGYAATVAPLIPRGLAAGITAIAGLSDTVRLANHLDVTPQRLTTPAFTARPFAAAHAAPKACASAASFAGNSFWTPDQVGTIYGVNGLVNAGIDGRGRKIAMVEFAPSRPADTSAYLACYGLHNAVTVTAIDGGATPDVNGTLEAEVDIQEAATAAPGATIVSYEAPNSDQGNYDVFSRIVADNVPVVSTSWGLCEDALVTGDPGMIDALHTLFQQAAAQGQSIFSASGDQGSEDCYDPAAPTPDDSLQVDNPADDPFVTGVGGTSLEAAGVEPVWNDCEATADSTCAAGGGGAAGGGESTHFLRPAWQPLATNARCSNCRGVPDISANSGVGEVFYDSDAAGPDHWIAVGGTSIAAPKLAGIVADINSACIGGRIGDFAPRLAALAADHVYGTALDDVTTGLDLSGPNLVEPGDNDLTRNQSRYLTAAGFDLATGYGTPRARGLACPQITALAPTHGAAGTRVTLHGLGLERARIKFGSASAKVLSAGSTQATVVVPPGSGVVRVAASDPIGAGARGASFRYPAPPSPPPPTPDRKRSTYRTFAADGGVFAFGGAAFYGSPTGVTAPVVGAAADSVTDGYWLAASDGTVHNLHAPALGSMRGVHLNQAIVGIAAMPRGDGYWLVARDGGVFAFGRARFFGSTGGMHLNQPIVGIAATPRGDGYWLVARDGGVFAFGRARFFGSMGGAHLNQPIVGMASDPATGGYWLVARDGGVFAFHAPFSGSTGALRLNRPIVGMAGDPSTGGYRLVASDGGVFAFHASFLGSTAAITLNQPIVAIGPAR